MLALPIASIIFDSTQLQNKTIFHQNFNTIKSTQYSGPSLFTTYLQTCLISGSLPRCPSSRFCKCCPFFFQVIPIKHHFKPLSNSFNICFCNIPAAHLKRNTFSVHIKNCYWHYKTQIQFCVFSGALSWDLTYELISSCRKIFRNSRCPKQLLLFCWKGFCIGFFIVKIKIINYCLHKVDSTFHRAETKQKASKRKTGEK